MQEIKRIIYACYYANQYPNSIVIYPLIRF